MPPKQIASLWERRKYASWVIAARWAARKQALWLPIWEADLAGMPVDVVREIVALKPKRPRYRSLRLNRATGLSRRVTMGLPKHVKGFHRVMAAIAEHAGCKPATLYPWVDEYEAYLEALRPVLEKLRPGLEKPRQKGPRPKRTPLKSGDIHEHTHPPLTDHQRQLWKLVTTIPRGDDKISE